MQRWTRAPLVLVLLAAAGCGSSPATPSSTVPTITAISPSVITVSSTPQTLTVTGTNFVFTAEGGAGVAVNLTVNISPLPNAGLALTNIMGTQFQLSNGVFQTPGTYTVTATVNGLTSNAVAFTVKSAS